MPRKTRDQYVEELKIKNPDVELVGDYLIANGIVKEKIVLGLKKMGQKTLLSSVGYIL